MQATEISSLEQFKTDVTEASVKSPVVVLFWATWCGPCKSLKPKLFALQESLQFPLATVDAGAAREVAIDKMVRSVPTVLVFNQGKEVLRVAGDKPEGDLKIALLKAGVSQQCVL